MTGDSRSLLLTDLTTEEVAAHLESDRRMIIPIGSCDQYGPHLPIGATTRVVEIFARQLSEEFGVLRAPTVPYGVSVPAEGLYPGASTLREKTLHSVLNDLLGCWEDSGFEEFILLTLHDYDSHVEAIATVTLAAARVRVVELGNMDFSGILEGFAGPEHGGEMLTALMLHLDPTCVRMDRAMDFTPRDRVVSTLRRQPRIPAASPGNMGHPTLATPEKGQQLYQHIYEKIRNHLFLEGEDGAAKG